jgi:hypothetical protein
MLREKRIDFDDSLQCRKRFKMAKSLSVAIFAVCFIWSCTYSVNLVHTEGSADDIIDEYQEAKADVSSNLSPGVL